MAALLLAAAGAATVAPPAWADHQPSKTDQAEKYAREGVEKLLRALDRLIESIPQYEMPVIDDNGDIIIRRRRGPEPRQPAPAPDESEADQTDT